VPIPQAPVLAAPRRIAPGTTIDGVTCQNAEKVAWRTHAHLTIFVNGTPQQVPAGIGIGTPRQTEATNRGPFVDAGSCFAWLHTHAADGIIHPESPLVRTYTLGQFFRVWGQPLDDRRVGPARGHVTAFVNGRRYTRNPRRIPLLPYTQIQLDVGTPVARPKKLTFPRASEP
jgi:hypothetical protein